MQPTKSYTKAALENYLVQLYRTHSSIHAAPAKALRRFFISPALNESNDCYYYYYTYVRTKCLSDEFCTQSINYGSSTIEVSNMMGKSNLAKGVLGYEGRREFFKPFLLLLISSGMGTQNSRLV